MLPPAASLTPRAILALAEGSPTMLTTLSAYLPAATLVSLPTPPPTSISAPKLNSSGKTISCNTAVG